MGWESARPPAVAGTFYSASPTNLRRDVKAFLAARSPRPEGATVKALIAPHAGYVYSGPIAGSAFSTLRRRHEVRTVVLLGPAHYVPVRGLALPADSFFETPLGRIPIDGAAVAEAAAMDQVVVSREAHAPEHSLEVELPFLQVALGEFSLLPLVVGSTTPAAVAAVLSRLWGGSETVIVVSSDLSHYHSYQEARGRDRRSTGRILDLDPTLSPTDACGSLPINGLLTVLAERLCEPELLDLRNSGDTAGDRDRVVGYAAIAFWERQ